MRTQNARLERCKSQTDSLPNGLISVHGVFGEGKVFSALLAGHAVGRLPAQSANQESSQSTDTGGCFRTGRRSIRSGFPDTMRWMKATFSAAGPEISTVR